MPLKSRQLQIPGGMVFYIPELKWRSTPFASFDVIVQSIIAARRGNPHLMQKFGWATDVPTVEGELDAFCTRVCQMNGWLDYVTSTAASAPPPPKTMAPQQQANVQSAAGRVKKIWSGLQTLNEWYVSGESPVAAELSTARAKTCSECPLNEPGDFGKWFTAPAAEAIQKVIAKFADRNLSTPYDDKLHTCRACMCANKLSVHAPIAIKIGRISDEVFNELKTAPDCWVVREAKAIGRT